MNMQLSPDHKAPLHPVNAIPAEAVLQKIVTPRRVPADPQEQALLADARLTHVTHRDRQLAVWQWGSTGPQVLLVHGWDSRASHLGGFVRALLAAGYRVLAFDGPAQGESEGSRSNVVDLGQAALRVAEAAGPVEATIGHSMGSPALLYAFAQGLLVRASIHICGPSSLKGVLHRTAGMLGMDAEQRDRLLSLMEAETGIPLENMELSRLANGLRHPALIIHDPEDREIPFEESRRLQSAWPGAMLQAVSGVGHRRIINDLAVIELGVKMLSRHLPVNRP